MKFRNKIAIVTGGSSGIGLACALRLAREGATVLNADIRQPNSEAEAAFRAAGAAWSWLEADLANPQSWAHTLEAALKNLNGVDVLVNNAAYVSHVGGSVLDTTLEEWNRQIDITQSGTFLASKISIPWMIERGGGAIVNISSIGGLNPFADTAAYSTAKAAVVQLTKSIAIDYGYANVRCNAVCPGAIDTPTFGSIKNDPFELADREARTSLGRIGQADEVAAAIEFLASSDASYITGATLVVDGGWTASQWSNKLGPRSANTSG